MAFSVLDKRDELGVKPGRLWIEGAWTDASSSEPWTQVHPATGESVAEVAVASAADVDRAVGAARSAFDEGSWTNLSARKRSRIMRRIGDKMYEHRKELNRLQTLDNGMPISFSGFYQVSAAMLGDLFYHYAGWVDKIAGETLPPYDREGTFTMTVREPVGVVGSIIPWNAPLILLGLKIAPALATGCTVVLKPSEYASLCALRVAELIGECGVPKGVVNVITGPGAETGEALIGHPSVDKVSFTGSRAIGQHIMEVGAKTLKRVTLELGGKSAHIIFPDAPNLDMTAASMMGGVAMGLSGQGCACLTRALVHVDVYEALIEKASQFANIVQQGDVFDPSTNGGPLINPKQLDRVLGYIERGVDQGARLVCGGKRSNGELNSGNWVQPTLFADVDNEMTIAQEEIFGPVLSVIPFESEEDAIRIANASDYGLAGAVHTSDVGRAMRVARAIRTGTFGVNTYHVVPNAPFGGYKQSGFGREGGGETIGAYTETKTIIMALSDKAMWGG